MFENAENAQQNVFLREHPNVNFVLIDTIQKIRDMKFENYSFAGDYKTMTTLKSIADRFGIAIVLIHHTRKAPSRDPFDMVSGTTGLMGCADSTFVMLKENRLADSATLDATGRDIENLHFPVATLIALRLLQLSKTFPSMLVNAFFRKKKQKTNNEPLDFSPILLEKKRILSNSR